MEHQRYGGLWIYWKFVPRVQEYQNQGIAGREVLVGIQVSQGIFGKGLRASCGVYRPLRKKQATGKRVKYAE